LMAPGGADVAQDLQEVSRRDAVLEAVGGGNGGSASDTAGDEVLPRQCPCSRAFDLKNA
jgi:hypothetical protein